MKAGTVSVIAGSMLIAGSALATIIPIDLSPLPGAALNPINYPNGDHTLGLSAPNAVNQPASPATGNEVGAGIFFDDVTKVLTYNLGYGSDFGFVDLLDNFTVAHIHGPSAVNFPAPNTGAAPISGGTLVHLPGSSGLTGSFVGSVVLGAADEGNLLTNQLYINIHSQFATGGEIRGQLIPVIPEPASMGLVLLGVLLIGGRRLRR